MKKLLIIGLAAVASSAFAVDFDFESEAVASYAGSQTFSNSGLDLTASVASGWVQIISGPSAIGTRALLGTENQTINGGEFLPVTHTFSQDIQSATFLFKDNGGDDDGTVSLALYDSGNALIATLTQAYGTSSTTGSITINQTFRSAVFSTDSPPDNLHSLTQEWADVEAVPEPATMTILGLGALAALRRKKRSA